MQGYQRNDCVLPFSENGSTKPKDGYAPMSQLFLCRLSPDIEYESANQCETVRLQDETASSQVWTPSVSLYIARARLVSAAGHSLSTVLRVAPASEFP